MGRTAAYLLAIAWGAVPALAAVLCLLAVLVLAGAGWGEADMQAPSAGRGRWPCFGCSAAAWLF